MKRISIPLTILALLAVVTLVRAQDATTEPAKKPARGLRGTVVKVDGMNLIIKARGADAETTVVTDADTAVTINGEKGALADLKEGQMVNISPATGTAKKITVGKRGAGGGGATTAPAAGN